MKLRDKMRMETVNEMGGWRGCLTAFLVFLLVVLAAVSLSWLVVYG